MVVVCGQVVTPVDLTEQGSIYILHCSLMFRTLLVKQSHSEIKMKKKKEISQKLLWLIVKSGFSLTRIRYFLFLMKDCDIYEYYLTIM